MRCRVLRHQVTFQSRPTARDGMGQVTGDWADVVTVSADCEPLSGREFFAARQDQESVSMRITIRHREGIHGGMRVLWRGQLFDIVGDPVTDATRQWLQLMVASGVRDAL